MAHDLLAFAFATPFATRLAPRHPHRLGSKAPFHASRVGGPAASRPCRAAIVAPPRLSPPPPSSRPRRRRPTRPSQRQQLRLRLDERDAVADGRCAALHRAQQRVDERFVLAQDRARLSERPQRARVVRLGRLCSARRGAPAGGPKRKGRGAGGRRSSASATSASRRHLRATAGGVDGTRRVPRASALTRRALARPHSP